MDYPFLVKTGKPCNHSHGKEIHDSLPARHETARPQRFGAAPTGQDSNTGAETGQGGPQVAGAV
jgi:hypothetical protein